MKVCISNSNKVTHAVSEMILGHNIETASKTVSGFLSDRLENPKFLGPAEPMSGVAPGWHPSSANMTAVRCQLTLGMSLSGNESQMVQNYSDKEDHIGIIQTERSVKKGEQLEVEIWAKVKHHPVTLIVRLSSDIPDKAPYDEAKVSIDASYWKQYKVVLNSPCDSDKAIFRCCLVGEGIVYFDQIHMRLVGEELLCKELIDGIGTLGIPVLRFPGGCISTNYHWFHGVGAVHKRPALNDPVFLQDTSYDFGTDEYLELCYKYDIKPFITVNIGSGTPEEAYEWACYCANWFKHKGQPPPEAYFQMGNEHYGMWETAHMTGEMYVDALREFVPAVRKGYPRSKILALGEKYYDTVRKQAEPAPWRDVVLDGAADLVEIISLSRYKGQWFDDYHEKQINVVESVNKIQIDLESLIEDCAKANPELKIAITEWNYWTRIYPFNNEGSREPDDAQHALYVAGVLNLFARFGDKMEVANFYHLVNGFGIFFRDGAGITQSSLTKLFRLYRPAFPGKYVTLEVDSPLLGDAEQAVDAMYLQQDDCGWLFILNYDDKDEAEISLKGFEQSESQGVMLFADSPMDSLQDEELSVKQNVIKLPPLSISRFKMLGD